MAIEWRRSDANSWDGYVREHRGNGFRPVLSFWVYKTDLAPPTWRYMDFYSYVECVDFTSAEDAMRYAETVHRLEQ